MRVRGGRNVYGVPIGILMLDTRFPRVPGDIGNAETFPFPVLYRRVPGAWVPRVVQEGDPALLEPFIEAARELERDGVAAITTGCGFLAKFQRQIAAALRVPFFSSSLMQIPLVAAMLPPGRKIGVLTVDARSLTREHLEGAGVPPSIPLVIRGLEAEAEFSRVILGDEPVLDVARARAEHVRVARRMVEEEPAVGAIVLECTNMPPYAADIQAATGLPVFDIQTLIRFVHAAVAQTGYPPPPAGMEATEA